VPPRVSAWERGLKLFPSVSSSGPGAVENAARNGKEKEEQKSSIDVATPSLAHIHACLRILDTYLLEVLIHHFPSRTGVSNGTRESREESEIRRALADGELLDGLVELCVATEILVRECVRDLDNVAMNRERGDGVEQHVQEEGDGELGTFSHFFPSSAISTTSRMSLYQFTLPTHTHTLLHKYLKWDDRKLTPVPKQHAEHSSRPSASLRSSRLLHPLIPVIHPPTPIIP
jgi:hypothetical protein